MPSASPDGDDVLLDHLSALSESELYPVLRVLSSVELARLQCCSRSLRSSCSDDRLWRVAVETDWLLGESCATPPEGAPSFAAAYRLLEGRYGRYKPFFARTSACVDCLRELAPQLGATLLPGSTEAELDEMEDRLKTFTLPPCVRLFWRLLGGQNVGLGLFGGILVYDHYTTTAAVPPQLALGSLTNRLFVAASRNGRTRRYLYVDCASGDVFLCDGNHPNAPPVRACPAELEAGSLDGFLRWLEAFTQNVRAGVFRIEQLLQGEPLSRQLSLFPAAGPRLASCVSAGGVRVQASSVYCPELSSADRGAAFAYRVRFSLLSEEEQMQHGAARPRRSVQLLSRRWLINDGVTETVTEGPGVIGEHPLLLAGAPEWAYQSMCYVRHLEASGSMSGSFDFVEGSIDAPLGRAFPVTCPEFRLAMPEDGFLF